MDESPHKEREHFLGSVRITAGLTMLSRIAGLARDAAIMGLGANRNTDAFWTAFAIPNLFRRLFGEGALSAAFVPVFTEVGEKHGWDRARAVLANTAGGLAVILAGVVVLGELGLLLWLLLAEVPGDWQLLGRLTMLVLPFMFTVCLLALGSAALNCKGHFAYPAFAPILLNIFLIGAAVIAYCLQPGDQWAGLALLCIAAVAAGVAQLVGVVWLLRSVKLAAVPSIRPVLPATKRIARLALPMMIPLGVLQFSALFDRIYAWVMTATPTATHIALLGHRIERPLTEGVVVCLNAGNRLYQFPLAILAISLATVVFPLFSRYAARDDTAGLREATNRALRLSLFMAIPAGTGLVLLARPAVELIYRHGRFTDADVARSTFILRMYCLGMWAYFCNHILLRAFFAQKDTRTPLRVSCAMAGVNMLLVIGLVFTPLKAGAFGLATAITSTTNALLLVWVLRRRWGRIGLRRILASLARTIMATAALAAPVLAVLQWGRPLVGGWGWAGKLAAGAIASTGVVAGALAFLLAAWAMRCEELGELRASTAGELARHDARME